MLNQVAVRNFKIAFGVLIPMTFGICIGMGLTPTTKTITVEKPVEKIVEKVVYVPQPVQQNQKIPFDMDEGRAFKYRQCPDVVNTYVIINGDYTNSPKTYIDDRWPNFGQVISIDLVGEAINAGHAQIFRVAVKKYDCWK